MKTLLHQFLAVFRREFKLAMRNRADIVNPLVFFALIIAIFPLGVGADPELLLKITPGIFWVAALLANLLALDRLFKEDYQDGTLDQLVLSPISVEMLIYGKVAAHWLLTAVPLIIMTPLLALMMNMPSHAMAVLLQSLIIGTPILGFIGAIGSALTLGLRNNQVLMALLIMPLYVPILIFGAESVQAALLGLPFDGQLQMLSALLVLSLTLAPLAAAAALRITLS